MRKKKLAAVAKRRSAPGATRRRFAFWLGMGAFTLAEQLKCPAIDNLAAKVMNTVSAPVEPAVHWSPESNEHLRWFQRETFIDGLWQVTGLTTPVDKASGEMLAARDGYLDMKLVPDAIRNASQTAVPPRPVVPRDFGVARKQLSQEAIRIESQAEPAISIDGTSQISSSFVESTSVPLEGTQSVVVNEPGVVVDSWPSTPVGSVTAEGYTVVSSEPVWNFGEVAIPTDEISADAADSSYQGARPDPVVKARHGLPPSKWLRSLHASELRIWMKGIQVPEVGVGGMTFWVHLTEHHLFDPQRIQGLNDTELAKLHAAAHFGY